MNDDLLAIIEMGGYPNLMPLYQRLGFQTSVVHSQRQARRHIKNQPPDIIVAEYNLQSDFRDRSSNLETLMAILQRLPDIKLLVFYLPEFEKKFTEFRERHAVTVALPLPVDESAVEQALNTLKGQ